MAVTPEQVEELLIRLVQRGTDESNFVNTINLADRITIDFVWYPGARDLPVSLINVILPLPTPGAKPLEVLYVWSRQGMTDIKRTMASGRITVPLAPGSTGVLNVFDTQWEVRRMPASQPMAAANEIFGVLRRLNALGYHLRVPGAVREFEHPFYAQKGERAVLAFQVDYKQPAPAKGPAGPLHVRGEFANNPDIQIILDVENGLKPTDPHTPNPSAADGAALQAALVAIVGM